MTKSGNPNEQTENLMPRFFCNNCYNAIYGDEKRCPDCGKIAPMTGFPSIEKSLDPWLGRVIADRYFVNRRIGRGGTGSVYRIQQMPYGRTLAIKIVDFANLPADTAVDTLEKRLNREILALRKLRSPHIVQLYEVLYLPDKVVGVVMDYINGKTLDLVIRNNGPLRPKRALNILRQIATGVLEAHEAGMIHRDLKPENIMVETMSNSDDFIHILDFGVVRMDDGLRLTQGFLGTPLYASPEQSMAKELDCRTDIYSLGGILYFMLTGTPPYNYESIFDILQAHAQADVPTLHERTNILFPGEIESLVGILLAKDPNDRPDNLAQVLEWIDECIQGGSEINFTRPKEPMKAISLESIRASLLDPLKSAVPLGENKQIIQPVAPHSLSFGDSSHLLSYEKPKGEPIVISSMGRLGSDKLEVDDNEQTNLILGQATTDPDETPGSTTPSPWAHHEVATLFNRIDKHCIAFSGTHDALSIALLSENGIIRDIHWKGNLSSGPNDAKEDNRIHCISLNTELLNVTTFFNGASEYLIGTNDGAIYSLEKKTPGPNTNIRIIFAHPNESPVAKIAASCTKFQRKIVAFKNGDIYVAGDGIGQVKGSASPDYGHDIWVRIFKERPVEALTITPNGESFAIIDSDTGLSIYSFSVPGAAFAKSAISSRVKEVVFSSDGHVVALLRDDKVIELRHTISGAKLTTLHDPDHNLCFISFGLNGGFFGYYTEGTELRVIDLQREMIRST